MPERMKDSTAKVLRLLRRGPQTTGSFAAAFCPRASARIHELRHVWGCDIDAERIEANAYRFTLTYEPPGLPVGGEDASVPPRPAAAVDRGVAHIDTPAAGDGGSLDEDSRRPAAAELQLFDTVPMEAEAMFGFGTSEAA